MRILYCGDVVGQAGRKMITEHLPRLRAELKLDFVLVNGENAAHGFGITDKIAREMFDAGADCVTLGNHTWDQKDIVPFLDAEPRMIRPLNFPAGTPGRGAQVYRAASGRSVLVIQVMGRLFMESNDCPFTAADRELDKYRLGASVDAIVVDLHAEATSEKMSLGHHLDGRVSLAAGTHTHVPTDDAMILAGGTGYVSDIGMCGAYDSVIGMEKENARRRFVKRGPTQRLEPAEGEGTLSAIYVETDDRSGLATRIAPLRFGGRLIERRV